MNRKLPFGIDRPELHQAFGRKAKKFTSRMVFHKNVSLTRKDTEGTAVPSVLSKWMGNFSIRRSSAPGMPGITGNSLRAECSIRWKTKPG